VKRRMNDEGGRVIKEEGIRRLLLIHPSSLIL
jgi:hypothetical protein